MKKVLFWWPVFVLILVFVALFITNYHPNMYLLGWDTTSPELNLGLNFRRYVFAIWQEYRGLGSVDGQSYTANIVHWVYIAFLSLFLPQNLVRYTFTLLCHLIGGFGLFVLLRKEIFPSILHIQKKNPEEFQERLNIISLIGALIYQFNFMTIQMFYTPFETFTIHFAFIPWGIWALLRFFKKRDSKSLLLLAFVNVLGVSQAQVPTVFIAYSLLLTLLFLTELFSNNKNHLKTLFVAGTVLILINSFWGLPYVYSATTKAQEIANSKQNRYSTVPMFYRNKAYGNLNSLALFGSFNLDYISWNKNQKKAEPLMGDWNEKYNSPHYKVASYFVFSLALLGVFWAIIFTLRSKKNYLIGFIFSFIFFFGLLAVNIPGFKDFFEFLQKLIPLFANVFRAPFTKFSTIYVALLSIFVAFFLFQISTLTWIKNRRKLMLLPVYLAFILAISVFSDLTFKKSFFYSDLFVTPPQEYKESFTFLSAFGDTHRVIYLPMHSFWGWLTNTNNWGYLGSGFIWQAIPQPLHYRSFDSWSKKNETAFLQMSHALYQFDPVLFQKTAKKYHSDLVFFEKSVSPYGPEEKKLFYSETENLIIKTQGSKIVKKFDDIDLYLLDTESKNLAVYSPNSVTSITKQYDNDYTHTDQAFNIYENYILDDQGITFPLSYLQKQEIYKVPYEIINNEAVFYIDVSTNEKIVFPRISETLKSLPASIYASSSSETKIQLQFKPQLPNVFNKEGKELTTPHELSLEINKPKNNQFLLEVANAFYLIDLVNISNESTYLGLVALPTQGTFDVSTFEANSAKQTSDEYVKLSTQQLNIGSLVAQLDNNLRNLENGAGLLTLRIPLGLNNDFSVPAKELFITSKNVASNCSPFKTGEVKKTVTQSQIEYFANKGGVLCEDITPNLNQNFEYLYFIEADVENGQGLRQSLFNTLSDHTDLEIVLTNKSNKIWFPILPTQQPNSEVENNGFRLVTNLESFGEEQNTVTVKEMKFTSMPLTWLTGIRVEPENFIQTFDTTINSYKKSENFWYTVNTTVKSDRGLLVLPQSFDPGWTAFTLDKNFTILNKVQYNGWANAWYIPKGDQYSVYILFWPQLLVFAGYFLLFTTLSVVILRAWSTHLQKRRNKQLREAKLLPIKQVLS